MERPVHGGEGGVTGSRDAGQELSPGQVNPRPVRLPGTCPRKAAELRFPLGYNIKPAHHGSEVRGPCLSSRVSDLGTGEAIAHGHSPGPRGGDQDMARCLALWRAAGKALRVHWGGLKGRAVGTVTEESQVFEVGTHT